MVEGDFMYKNKLELKNKILMTFIFILLIINFIGWILLKEYVYAIIFILITLVLFQMYYFTSYYFDKEHLVVKLGLIKLKFKYQNIIEVKEDRNQIYIQTNIIGFHVNPSEKEKFKKELSLKMKVK